MQALLLGMILATQRADGLDTKIPVLDAMARPVDEITKQLAAASGLVFVTANGIGREPVIVHLKDKTVQQIMDELAYVCDGVWIEKNGAWTLNAQATQASGNAELVAAIEKVIGERKEVAWGPDSADEYVRQVNEGRAKMKQNVRVDEGDQAYVNTSGNGFAAMGGQVLNAAMRQLGAQNLAQIGIGQRFVWSTAPNRRQIAFPGNLSEAIQRYRQVANDVAAAAKKNPPGDYGFNWSGDFGIPSSASADVSKVNVIGYRAKGSLSVGVQLIGRGGEELLFVSNQFSLSLVEENSAEEATGEEIPLSAASRQLIGINEVGQGRGGMSMVMMNGDDVVRLQTGRVARAISLDAGLKEIIDNPGGVDFLKLFVGEALPIVFPEQEVVSVVPDQLWSNLYLSSKNGDLRESEAKSAFAKWTLTSMNAGVRRIRPKDVAAARQNRINRGDLGALINKTNINGYAKLQDGATYVRSRGSVVESDHADAVLLSAGQPFLSELLTRTLGILYQHSVLLSMAPDLMTPEPGKDQKWEYARMNNGMRSSVESLLFNQPLWPTMGGQSQNISVNTEALPPPTAAQNEATERYPNGIPSDYAVTYSINEEQGVLGRVKGQRTGRMLTAMDFGAIYGFIEGQGGSQGEYPMTQFEEFLDATVRAVAVNLPGNTIDYTDGRLAVGARPKSVSELEKSFLERGQFARDTMRRAGQEMGNRRNQAPPPK